MTDLNNQSQPNPQEPLQTVPQALPLAGQNKNNSLLDGNLGISNESDLANEQGIRTMLESGMISYGRLPMLEVVYDRLMRLMSTSLRALTSDNVEITMESIQTLKFQDFLDTIEMPCMLSVFKAEEWDNFGLMALDSGLIYSLVDVLMGGRAQFGNSPDAISGRAYTTIERSLIERLCKVVLNDLSISFDPLSTVNMQFDRLESSPKFASITSPTNAAVIATFFIQIDTRGGNLSVVFPLVTLEPIRELLLQMYLGEKFGRDSIWESHLAEQLWLTNVDIVAVLDEFSMPLGDVLGWEIGSFLPLDTTQEDAIKLRSGNKELFNAEIGYSGEYMAVKIIGPIAKRKKNHKFE